jgi:enoyl-CoA hydratase/carnithine racemase
VSVRIEHEGAVAWLWLNRPAALNAFDARMVARMRACVAELATDPGVRAVVLAGAGRAFCTGVDVKGLAAESIGIDWFRDWLSMTRELQQLEMPVVAAVQGHCLGGGLMLTLAADYRIGAEDLQIGLGAVRHGILPGCAPQRLPAVVGSLAARRLCLFGEYVDAAEALRIGLVDRVVPAPELRHAARAVAERAARLAAPALRELKRLLQVAPALDEDGYAAAYLAAQARCLAERSAKIGGG